MYHFESSIEGCDDLRVTEELTNRVVGSDDKGVQGNVYSPTFYFCVEGILIGPNLKRILQQVSGSVVDIFKVAMLLSGITVPPFRWLFMIEAR